MTINQQFIALYTLVRREVVRMFRIATQVFLPPAITTALYFLIFGTLIGDRIGPVQGVSYSTFIAPGLIMMSIITNAYGNVSTSLFSARFQKSVEEILVSPMHDSFLLIGYTLGGILRGVIVALLVFLVSCFFITLHIHQVFMTIVVVIMVSAIFSLAGFTNAMIARNFDDVMIIPTFVLTPLTYLGGVFYSTSMLPGIWPTVSHFNPILYMVNALRHTMINQQEVNMTTSMIMITLMLVFLVALNLFLFKKGTGLRE
ncbi:ABC transporter permease [Legionella spiritensis]|uniref:ABC transporter permease n=1 Tax=Legionella spiritensis TaxID=452 RepID=UPI000F71B76E|nr:ABC transporter permease [Legionella spiritensis]VEG91982.1 ABC transporter permease [Legionella spiritensis]